MNTQSNRTIGAILTGTLSLFLVLGISSACGAQDAVSDSAMTQAADTTGPALSALAVAPAAATVQVVSVNGSGCPMGSATISSVAADLSSFSVHFNGYSASKIRKNCQFMFNVPVPAGYTYAVASIPASGRANLATGATGLFAASYYFQGVSATATTDQLVTAYGPSVWTTTGVFEPEELQYAPCNASRNLAVNTSLRVSGDSSGASSISMDPDFTVQLSWRRCQ